MTDTKKPTPEDIEASPDRFRILNGGAVYDREAGHIVAHSGKGPYQITKANARQMNARKKEMALMSQLRGLAEKEGLALPEGATEEDILRGALDGVEAMTAHMKRTFLESKNIRGMAEAYGKLLAPLLGRDLDEDEGHTAYDQTRGLIRDLADLARAATAAQKEINGSNILDAEEI